MNQHEHCGGAREPLKKYSARESESSDQTKFSTSPLEKLKYTMYVELGMTAVVLVPFDPKMTSNELNGGCIFWQIIIKGKLGVILTIWGYSCNDWAR